MTERQGAVGWARNTRIDATGHGWLQHREDDSRAVMQEDQGMNVDNARIGNEQRARGQSSASVSVSASAARVLAHCRASSTSCHDCQSVPRWRAAGTTCGVQRTGRRDSLACQAFGNEGKLLGAT